MTPSHRPSGSHPSRSSHGWATLLRSTCTATTLALLGTAAWAAPSASGTGRSASDIDSTYRSERRACMEGRSGQDLSTCMKEAGAARQQARGGGLDDGQTPAQLQRNALIRCEVVPAADRNDCQRLARGEGKASGSVAGGGVYRELTTRTVMPVETPAPAPR